MRPQSWQVLGNELVVIWDDGHESYYPLEQLRRACPCASCSGEPDLFGRMSMGPKPRYVPASFQLESVTPIGNGLPAIRQKVGSRSIPMAIERTVRPPATVPGCHTMNGTR